MLAVGRLHRSLNDARQDRSLVDSRRKAELRSELPRHLGGKRNVPALARGDGYTTNLPAPGDDDLFAVRGEGVVRKKIASVERFLVIPLDRVFQPAFIARGQVADAKASFGFISSAVHKFGSVGRDRGTEGAFWSIRNCVFFSRDAVAA